MLSVRLDIENLMPTALKKLTPARARLEQQKQQARQSAIDKVNNPELVMVLTEERQKVQEMSMAYENAYSTYKNKIEYCNTKGLIERSSPLYGIFSRAARFADDLGVDYSTYMRAMFYCSDKYGNRAPTPQECASFRSKRTAKDRVREYLLDHRKKEQKPIVGPVREAKPVSQAVRWQYSRQQMKTFMKNYGMSEEDVLREFARGRNAEQLFDKSWLAQNETYLRLREAGELQ